MRKNVASQNIAFQMNSATTGAAVTAGTPTVYYTVDGGVQGTGGGASVHEGNGQWSYVPAQAETNGAHVAFTMAISGAISQTVNVWPVSYDPGDAVRLGITALPDAAADAAGGIPISIAGSLDLDALNTAAVRLTAARAQVLDDWINAGRLDLLLDAIKAVTDVLPDAGALTTIGADTARMTAARAQVLDDWINAGRLDAILDIIAADVVNLDGAAMRGTDSAYTGTPPTVTQIQAEMEENGASILDTLQDRVTAAVATATALATAQTDLDTLTGTDGVTLATSQPNYAPNTTTPPTAAAIRTEIDSNSTQLTAIVADTNELQLDDVPGLISALDVVVDRVEADTQDIQARIPSARIAVDVTFSAGGSTTTAVLNLVDGAAASSTNDFYNGRVLVFTAPAALKHQATDITDYDGGTLTATITAVTVGPVATATAIML